MALRCILSPNWKIITLIAGELQRGQTQHKVKFDFRVKFDLEDEGQSHTKSIRILTKVFTPMVQI